jgi:hypothetical protein
MLSVLIPGAINVLLSPYLPFKLSIKSSADRSVIFLLSFSYNSIIVGLSLALFCILLNSFSKPQVDPNVVPQINPGSINTTPVQPSNTGGLNVMNKVNQNSRLALAGNDPLMQGIAMNNRRAI